MTGSFSHDGGTMYFYMPYSVVQDTSGQVEFTSPNLQLTGGTLSTA